MTTNKEALEKIFEAALKQADTPMPSSQQARRPKYVTPSTLETTAAVNAVLATPPPDRRRSQFSTGAAGTATMTEPVKTEPFQFPSKNSPATTQKAQTQPAITQPTPTAKSNTAPVLDDKASDELGDLLEKKLSKESRSRKRNKILTVAAIIIVVGGGAGWFVQSEDRVNTVKGVFSDIRSATDAKELAGSYEESLDKVSARSKQIDQASLAMGITDTTEDPNDTTIDDEMRKMMGGEGKTTGERDRAVREAFGARAKESGGIINAGNKELTKDQSFSFE